MLRKPSSILDKKEQALLDSAPEECFRRAVERGALSLDEVTERLSPRVAAAVRSIVTGERLTVVDFEHTRSMDALWSPQSPQDVSSSQQREHMWEHEAARKALSHHSQLTSLLDEHILTPDDAIEAAQALDSILGRYLTGTRYAAP